MTHIHFLQGCCGSVKVYEFPREIITTYPECHPDIIHGKTCTAGYTECL